MSNAVDCYVENAALLFKKGYMIVNFKDKKCIDLIQEQIELVFAVDPTALHIHPLSDDERLKLIKQAKEKILKKQLVKKLLLENLDTCEGLLGSDLDFSEGYLRVSRPNQEGDFIDWHRDTFVGNSRWECNFWFPIFPLGKGAGLMVVEGSHLIPSNNVRDVEEKNSFRKAVVKGSIANELGYLYAPKCDDSIATMDFTRVRLISPEVGQALF